MTRPLCECHGLPMHRNGHDDGLYVKWICSVKNRGRAAKNYDALDGVGYNRKLLRVRRSKALARIRRREEQRGKVSREGRD